MKNSKNNTVNDLGIEDWEKELEYIENAMDGIRTAYAILESNHKFCSDRLKDLMPKEN